MISYGNDNGKLKVTETTEVVKETWYSLEELNAQVTSLQSQKAQQSADFNARIAQVQSLIEEAENQGVVLAGD